MPIIATDIKVYLSTNGLAGAITGTQLTDNTLHNLFAKVSAAEAVAGSTKYRAVFFKNEHATLTYEAIKAYIEEQTPSTDTSVEVGVAVEGKNASIEAIANEDTAPATVTFTATTTPASGADVEDLAPTDYIGIWVKRIVSASATAYSADYGKIATLGESAA